ncbi:toll/interleukin-1 receptor (TIR) domain-containing protein [Artemisia annua]|uniref:Toll/interleukin-1 receptor (TIR) domain-containing protein n=1 Tax=Artemisia annua TaxID=35608 RepID=A0A2U1M9K2_ARTAN|nr:toll/interleukin-1 receptor (TIR) domain-containing protein [Artemisia annua]
MASNSTSSIQKSFKYDVFLSFRGEDTRKNFVDHLYYALKQKGIDTYKDDEKIRKGKTLNDELIEAIEDSKFYIIVFSKNYAASSWCLEELVKIMDCQKMSEHTAYPVFLDVEPTEVRKQSGAVGAAYSKHENNESARIWREALKKAADLAGWELKNTLDGHEAKLVQKIVEEISLELRLINSGVDENLIGIETRINNVVSSLELGVDDVRMIGIKGMGGAGKTTLARAIYDHLSYQFEGYSFVENVREKSTPSMSDLNLLQKQILSDILSDQGISVSGVLEGKSMLKKKMCGRKVLIVLDDVDKIEQLVALAGDHSWFKPGSRIIITTRDAQLLIAHKVNLIRDVHLLDNKEAMCLFSRHAFGREIPVEGYKELSEQVVRYAAGLPLTIKVLGSFLCGKDDLDWKDALERLETIPLNETMKVLELSYMDLEEDYKEIFLHVACLLKGWEKDDAIRALESCGFCARIGLRVLELKSLITISEVGDLDMHDHIEEMGKNIVRRVNPNKPARHSRLWIDEEIEEILANDSGTQETESMRLNAYGLNFEIFMNGLANMKELRFLQVHGYVSEDEVSKWKFYEDSLHLPNALRFLRWVYYPFSSLPKTFQANNLVGLDMYGSNIVQLWKHGEGKALKLRFLKFTGCGNLRTLDLSVALNLETLILGKCRNLVEVHFQVTPNLKELRIDDCHRLEKLHMPAECPKLRSLDLNNSKLRNLHLGITPNLETLRLRDCTDMVELRMPDECPKLVDLYLSNLKLTTLHLGITPNLRTVSLNMCTDMVELHVPAECPKLVNLDLYNLKLRTLHLGITPTLETVRVKKCTDMVEVCMPVECPKLVTLILNCSKSMNFLRRITPNPDMLDLQIPAECPELVTLDLNNSKLTTLHLGITPNLETLRLNNCTDMVELHIPTECSKLVNLYLFNAKLRTLHLGITPNLERLGLWDCTHMVELRMPAECPKLVNLDLSYLRLRTLHLGVTPNLETLRLRDCTDMVELRMPAECPKLVNLDLSNLKLRTLHLGITPNLETLSLWDCTDMVELRMPAECLKLVKLDLSNLKLTTLHLGITPNLKTVCLKDCRDLVELQIPAECANLVTLDLRYLKLTSLHLRITPKLETLSLKDCCNLVELHLPFRCLKLKNLSLNGSKLRNLHLGMTPDLETLSLAGCDSLAELHMPFECLKLKFLSFCNTNLSTLDLGLTPNLQTLNLKGCHDLVEIKAPIGCLKTLRCLDLTDCGRFESFMMDKWFPLVDVNSLLGLYVTVESSDVWPFWLTSFYFEHPVLSVVNLEKLISVCNLEISTVTICDFQCLRKLTLKGGIPEVPEFVVQLEGLEELILLSTKIKHLPESICMLKNLKILELKSCCLLEKLPENLGQLQCLEKLILTECVFLRDIPNSICEMKCLKYIHLLYCIQVAELPEGIGRLECLKELDITGTGISHLPQSILRVKGLRIIGFRWLLESFGFISEMKTSDGETYCYI